MEDEVDWDVSLKSQLHTISEKTRMLGNVTLDRKTARARLRDSSISNQTGKFREEGETRNIRNSAILDMVSRVGRDKLRS